MPVVTTTDGVEILYEDRGTGQPIVFSQDRVAEAVLIGAVPPLMVQTDANPGGLPRSVFDGIQEQVATNRSNFYRDLPSGPFYGFNRTGVEPSEAIIANWWRQG